MQIENNLVVSLHYKLSDDQGKEIENSFGDVPLVYLHGNQNLIPGLENALTGKQAGDQFSVTVSAEDGYGEYHEALKQEVPAAAFEGLDPQPGMQFTAETDQGPRVVTVVDVNDEVVTVDGNHAFAGMTLHFDVEVIELRDATEEELAHGHVHGAGGCGHDHGDDDHGEDKPEEGTCCGGCH